MNKDQIIKAIIYPAMEEITKTMDLAGDFAQSPDTALFGPTAALNSLALVSFVVIVEERIESQSKKTVRLVSEKTMSQKSSPFRSVSTLADFIGELIGDAK